MNRAMMDSVSKRGHPGAGQNWRPSLPSEAGLANRPLPGRDAPCHEGSGILTATTVNYPKRREHAAPEQELLASLLMMQS